MVVTRPPMGWNSWNTFAKDIDEALILKTADTMVSEGLLAAGYNYLVIDDCWSEKVRDANGKLVADREKFPHGMKYVADYVHSKGLKFGMYSCCGPITCAGYPGSYGHEFDDAASFASWGVDFLKYDYCFRDMNVPGELLYRRMAMALANCGRDILFSACNWGQDDSQNWIKATGAHMWRSTEDIFDTWGSIKTLALKQLALQPTNGHGCFNDMDMLVVGMSGKGHVARPGEEVTFEEYKTHFSLWCMFGSPLMIGCDIRKMSEDTKKILLNKELIALNQDPAYNQVFFPDLQRQKDEYFTAYRLLDGGDIAVGMFNLSDFPVNRWYARVDLAMLGLTRETGKTLHLRDLWSGEEFDCENDLFYLKQLDPHCCRVFRATLVDAKR